MTQQVPKSLRIWFLTHFIVDLVFAIPLIFFPKLILSIFDIQTTEFLTARLVGSALLGIGGASLFTYRKTKASFDIMLTLKIIWSVVAIFVIIISILEGISSKTYYILGIFAIFSAIWIYYKIKLR